MQPETVQTLLDLNRRFYEDFGPAFAATRRRVQDGVRRALDAIVERGEGGRWLDLGCGSGALAVEWLRRGLPGSYLGLDFSAALLQEATAAAAASEAAASAGQLPAGRVAFAQADLGDPRWADGLEPGFSGVMMFASLHHLPSHALRVSLLKQIHALLAPGGRLVHSEWQFQHAPKLMARVQPWQRAGLDPDALEPGDTLLDWRFALPGQAEQVGLRYVHLFSLPELEALARDSGFRVLETYESDGHGGRLSVYQWWQKTDHRAK